MNDKPTIQVRESYTNETKGYRIGDQEWYEPWTDDLGKLFRDYRSQFGACRGRVYQDMPNGGTKPVGWYFEKRMKYEDSDDTYLGGCWVEYRFPVKDCERAISEAFVATLS